jgi:leucyl-tRNA synthetase
MQSANEFKAPSPPTGGTLPGSKIDLPCRGRWGYSPQPKSGSVVHGSAKIDIYEQLKAKAKEMRLLPTPAENLMWEYLRSKKIGVKFRRQHVIACFIVDFYCIEKALVIEIDGDIHDSEQDRDECREEVLKSLGCKILRFKNEQVLTDLPSVLSIIYSAISPVQLHGTSTPENPPVGAGGL